MTKALLVCSSGGHLMELALLRDRMAKTDDVSWVTFDGEQSRSLLSGERVRYVPDIPPRDWRGALRSLRSAHRLIGRERPDLVVSTGAAIALPYLVAAAARRIPAHYIESAARLESPSLTGRMIGLVPGVRTHAQSDRLGRRWRPVPSVFDSFVVAPPRPLDTDRPLRLLVLLGTMRFDFSRLVRGLERVLPPEVEVVWQVGHTPPPEVAGANVHRFLSWAEVQRETDRCDVLLTHAGVGSVLGGLEAGLVPVVVPRRGVFGEHVDDHQVGTADALARLGLAIAVDPETMTWQDLESAATLRVSRRPDVPALNLDGEGAAA